MHLFRIAAIALVACCAGSCTNGPGPQTSIEQSPTFVERRIWLTADADRAVTDRSITITGTCTPLFRGKGRLSLWVSPNDTSARIVMEQPISDTLYRIGNSDTLNLRSHIAADFVPNVPVVGRWTFRLPADVHDGDYSFSAHALFDSVFIADSGKMLSVRSQTVRALKGAGVGYDWDANSIQVLQLYR